uniref:Uncharacterized protein n=1 Tax=Cannabis sativa TaxID=3483 RepID=A0A803PCI6_CANSA
MARAKQSCPRVPPYDPHVARVAIMGRIRVVEDATHLCEDVDPKFGQVEAPEVDQGVESSDFESEVEKDAPIRRRTYRTGSVLHNNPLGGCDANGEPLNKLG